MNDQSTFLKKIAPTQPDFSTDSNAIYIHHDQLNLQAFSRTDLGSPKPILIFIESAAKAYSKPYHKKKLVYLLSSLRHAALEAVNAGYQVIYWQSRKHYDDAFRDILKVYPKMKVTAMECAEIDSRKRLNQIMKEYPDQFQMISNSFFISDPSEWRERIAKGYRMEFFYREMRKRTGYLMDANKPEGGKWNFDHANRKAVPKKYVEPLQLNFEPDEVTKEVISFVEERFPSHFGSTSDFHYAISRKQALEVLKHFINHKLVDFGKYEDALKYGANFLNHSVIAVYLNNGLLRPREVCEAIIEAYRADAQIPIESVEGFIRQIIGWREYIRCYYEALTESIHEFNHFNFDYSIPDSFWHSNSGLTCVDQSVQNVVENGYAHHIQRLMVLSNFANLTNTNPNELNEWFWFSFIDAYDWVTSPNVLGMSTYADGGILASKPYVSSGSYIHKMSDYCSKCAYKVKNKLGEDACPFNYLYWHFVSEHQEVFEQNGRVGFMVNMYRKKSEEEKMQIKHQSESFIKNLKRYSASN